MAYDRDSFLAGLAVGRTLWRPHRDVPGASVAAYPCFRMSEVVPVEFVRWDTNYKGILFVNGDMSLWPEPVYWMLWDDGADQMVYFFSPDGQTAQNVVWLTRGIRESGTIDWFSTSYGPLTQYPSSSLGQYRMSIGYTSVSDPYIPALFATYDYFSGGPSEINAFFDTARLITVGDQLYVVGVENAV